MGNDDFINLDEMDEALSAAYKIWGVRIEPQNNTAQVINWKES